MDREALSVCLITKNEASRLGDCLASVAPVASEIVVVDSESTDGTEAVASRFGARFVVRPFDDFGRQKQAAVDLARCRWILLIDADERLTPELGAEILSLLADRVRLERYDSYTVDRSNLFLGKAIRHGGWSPDLLVRLFRKDRARLSAHLVHESVLAPGPVGRLSGKLLHLTAASLDDFLAKNLRYARLSAREKRARGLPPRILKVLLDPPFVFLRMYLVRAGFLDGKEGLFLALLYSLFTAVKYLAMYYPE